MKILAISGSLRKDSYNTALLRELKKLAPEGIEIEIADIGSLPLYNSDDETAFPASAQSLKDAITTADGVIIATPEYNRSISGVLKNAIDWASRPYGRNSFKGKPVLVAGVSVGRIGTAVAQTHLRQILAYLDAHVIGQPEIYIGPTDGLFDEKGILIDATVKENLLKALSVLVERIK